MSSVTVSVIIPTYNRARMLCSALDSLAEQTCPDFEAIVVDDGSTDSLRDAAEHRLRPRIIRQPRSGPGAARNRGVSESSGELIAFLDSDDRWLPLKLERFVDEIRAHPDVPIWYGPMQPVDADERPIPGRTKTCHGGWITAQLFESSFVHVPTVVCRRNVFAEFGGFDAALPVCEDYDLWLRISTKYPYGLVPEPLAKRRLHGQRLSKSCMRRNLTVKADVLERFFREHGDSGLLDRGRARRRIARVLLAAARAALRDQFFTEAAALARRAQSYGASQRRIWPILALARVFAAAGLERTEPEAAPDYAAPAAWGIKGVAAPKPR